MSREISRRDSPTKDPILKHSFSELSTSLKNATMKGIPPTPMASKSASPEYPEYPWLPNAHRDHQAEVMSEQQGGSDTCPQPRKSSHPENGTPDTPTTRDSLQRSYKRQASQDDHELHHVPRASRRAQQANETLGSAIESTLPTVQAVLDESADDERDDDRESDDDHESDKDCGSESKVVDPLCTAVTECVANSGDHRKVVSHIFGRNKTCTSQIPSECWIFYCRKHYQRHRFRAKHTGWKGTQFDIIMRQLARLETWGGVIDWEVALRKKEREALAIENRRALLNHTRPVYRESFLEPYLGRAKSYHDVYQLLQLIQNEITTTGATELPGFELLPNIDKKIYPPLKAKKKSKKPEGDAHASKSKNLKKRNRAATADATADAKSLPKRRRLILASDMTDNATAPRAATEPSSPACPAVLGFHFPNQPSLPVRPAHTKDPESTDGSQYYDLTDE